MQYIDRIKQYINSNSGIIITVCIFTFFILYSGHLAFFSGRVGWEDESHFWIIVKNCSVSQIFDLMKVEGHMMLWYLVVMPFAKLNLPYPYPMQILNWLFCLGAMIILWVKAPFNKAIKSLIILCPVFTELYAVHARCYSIGIFFLFLACALYKKRLEKPFLFFFVLFLGANTSILALFAATGLGILFLYDLYASKKYKTAISITLMTMLTGLLFFFQFNGIQTPDYEITVQTFVNSRNVIAMFLGSVPFPNNDNILISKIIAARIFILLTTFFFAKKGRVFFAYIFIFGITTLFFSKIYLPRYWHCAFIYIDFIICYWLFMMEKPLADIDAKYSKLALIAFISCLAIIVELPHDKDFLSPTIYNHEYLIKGKLFTNATPITMSILLPRLNENGIYIYDMNGRDLSSYEGLTTYYNEEKKKYTIEGFRKNLDKNKKNYLITTEKINKKSDFYKKTCKKLSIQGHRYSYYYYIYELK